MSFCLIAASRSCASGNLCAQAVQVADPRRKQVRGNFLIPAILQGGAAGLRLTPAATHAEGRDAR